MSITIRITQWLFCCIFVVNLYAHEKFIPYHTKKFSVDAYLLPQDHPLYTQLASLFYDSHMFQSYKYLKHADFKVKLGNHGKRLMVGAHPSIPDYLIKKFPNAVPQTKQLGNFIQRIKGAAVLRNYIRKHRFKHLVVPEKWLYRLPKNFPNHSYVLIVEKMDIYDDADDPNGQIRKMYYDIDIEVLTELCTLLHAVGGCDSLVRNIPFTRSGQIAFVDTESVGTAKTRGQFHKDTLPLFNPELQAYALALWEKLEQESKN